jgi:NADP-dependent 3-hydroxy acid dehydrogenase YdfG
MSAMQADSTNIAGKVVVITGASSGLGEATARYLAARGATVVLGARRVDRLQALVEDITGDGGKAIALATDVTDAAQVQVLVDAAVARYGRIDVLLNNAGLMPPRHSSGARSTTGIAPSMSTSRASSPASPRRCRTTIISPGPVATELPNSVTEPDIAQGIGQFYAEYAIPADSFARAVAFAISKPEEVDINEILFRPTRQEL